MRALCLSHLGFSHPEFLPLSELHKTTCHLQVWVTVILMSESEEPVSAILRVPIVAINGLCLDKSLISKDPRSSVAPPLDLPPSKTATSKPKVRAVGPPAGFAPWLSAALVFGPESMEEGTLEWLVAQGIICSRGVVVEGGHRFTLYSLACSAPQLNPCSSAKEAQR